MSLQSLRWSGYLRALFRASSVRKTPRRQIRLALEDLQERIVPSTFNPNPNATDGAGGSLRADIRAANADSTASATEVFDLSAGAVYTLTNTVLSTGHDVSGLTGNLVIRNAGAGVKTYIFVGLGTGATIEQTVEDRVFEIIGSNSVVEFKNVTITGGTAVDDGASHVLPGTTESLGGGILNEGATLELINSTLVDNVASGSAGAAGSTGAAATKAGSAAGPGGSGGYGQSAYGGGIYSTSGTITISDSTLEMNKAVGGTGGAGGAGGNVSNSATGAPGAGGKAGSGGNAGGGAVYMVSGKLTVENASIIAMNVAIAGGGGAGGAGGANERSLASGGSGGSGGEGGNVSGGGIAIQIGTVTITGQSQFSSNSAIAGAGGKGGAGGNDTGLEGHGGAAGNGGASGKSSGGGLFVGSGAITITSGSLINGNVALGGQGGAGGHGGLGAAGHSRPTTTGGGTTQTGGTTGSSPSTGGSSPSTSGSSSPSSTGTASSAAVRVGKLVPGQAAAAHGNGGLGVYGGQASGGGVYLGSGSLMIEEGASITANAAQAGQGGVGGSGGGSFGLGGDGGPGGAGGNAHGGGICIGSGTLVVTQGSAISDNSALAGVGGSGGAGGDAGTATVGVAGFGGAGGNSGNAFGGGIYSSGSSVTIEVSTVANNVAGVKGSPAAGGAGGSASGFSAMAGTGGAGGAGGIAIGGGIATAGGSLTINDHSLIEGNQAIGGNGGAGGAAGEGAIAATNGVTGAAGSALGGAIYAPSGTVIVNSVLVASNAATAGNGAVAQGGGIYLGEGKLTVAFSSVSDNRAIGNASGSPSSTRQASTLHATGGGGIYVWTGAMNVTIQSSSITNNTAATATGSGTSGANSVSGNAFGGGLYTAAAETTITDSTIALNSAASSSNAKGGGLFIASTDDAMVSNSTIARNTSTFDGGGIDNNGTLMLTSTLLSDNSSLNTSAADLNDLGVTTATDSIVENSGGNSLVNGLHGDQVGVPDSSINLSSTLATASNGTQYLNLGAPSIAIGNGSNGSDLTADQIGDERETLDATDVGAVQFTHTPASDSLVAYSTGHGTVELINSKTGQVYQDFQPFGTSYTGTVSVALGDVNGDGIPDLIVATHGSDAGQVLIYDGAAAIEAGVNLGDSLTWSNGTASILPGSEASPLLGAITPFANYRGGLTLAAGNLQGTSGDEDVIVGTVVGSVARVAAFKSKSNEWVQLGSTIEPFGARFTGGVTLAAASIQSLQPADIIVGSASQMAKLAVFEYSGAAFQQLGSTLAPFGSVSSGIQVAAVDPNDGGFSDIAAGTLRGGSVQIVVLNAATLADSGPFVSNYTVGKKLTNFELGTIDPDENGNEFLLLASVPGTGSALELDPLTGVKAGALELPVLTSGILLAGS